VASPGALASEFHLERVIREIKRVLEENDDRAFSAAEIGRLAFRGRVDALGAARVLGSAHG
jgi:hypothetical protein